MAMGPQFDCYCLAKILQYARCSRTPTKCTIHDHWIKATADINHGIRQKFEEPREDSSREIIKIVPDSHMIGVSLR